MQRLHRTKRLVLVILLAVVFVPHSLQPLQAQSGDCNPAEVEDWIKQRQIWRNATQETLDAQGVSINSALNQLADHLQAIEDLSRPGCADEAMLWTYYLYTNLQHLLFCAQVNDSACVTEMQGRLANYRERDEQLMVELASGTGLSQDVLAPPTPTPAPQTKTLGPIYDSLREENYSVEVGVLSYRFMKQSGFSEAKSGFVYVIVDLQIRNLGPGTLRSVYSSDFQVRDAGGAVRNDAFVDGTDDCSLDLVDLVAGGSVSGCVAFEVPETGSLELIYAPYQYEGLEEGRYLSFTLR